MTSFRTKAGALAAATVLGILAQPAVAQMPKVGPQCARLKILRNRAQALKAEFESIRIGDKRAWCPVERKIVANTDEVVRILESDSERCGVRDDIVDGLQQVNERAREHLSPTCGG
jgi:hypothetical protein